MDGNAPYKYELEGYSGDDRQSQACVSLSRPSSSSHSRGSTIALQLGLTRAAETQATEKAKRPTIKEESANEPRETTQLHTSS